MKIYIAIWEDRHTETTAHPFSDKDKAIEWAKKQAHDNDRVDGDVDQRLTREMIKDGWVYFGMYSCEGDNIRVVETELDNFDC